jgi:hypothetical protein
MSSLSEAGSMKKKNPDRPLNLLEMVPEKFGDWVRNDGGLAVILKPKFSSRLLRRYLVPRLKKPNFKISLDEKGSFLWDQIDGHRSVKELGLLFKNRFGDEAEPLFDRLGLFLQQLERNRFIRYIKSSD